MTQGYTFGAIGMCSDIKRCDPLPDPGFFFEASPKTVCEWGECTNCRPGQWKFIQRFTLRADKCPQVPIPRHEDAGSGAESDHACADIDTTLAADIYNKDKGSGEIFVTMTVVIVVVISGIVLLVVLVIIVFFTAKKGNMGVLTPSRRSSVTVASSKDQDFDTLEDGKAGSTATK